MLLIEALQKGSSLPSGRSWGRASGAGEEMQGFGSLALQPFPWAVWTVAAPWLEMSSVRLCSSSLPHPLVSATQVALVVPQVRVCPHASSHGRKSWQLVPSHNPQHGPR